MNTTGAAGAILVGAVSILCLVIGATTWAATTQIAGAIIVQGQIGVPENGKVIQHVTGGRIDALAAQEGDAVQRGDMLVRFETTDLQIQLDQVETALFQTLAQLAFGDPSMTRQNPIFDPILRVEAERNPDVQFLIKAQREARQAKQDMIDAARRQTGTQHAQLLADIAGLRASRNAAQEQLLLIEQDILDQNTLRLRGLAPTATVRRLQREEVRLQGMVAETDAALLRAAATIREVDQDAEQREITQRERASEQYARLYAQQLVLKKRRAGLRHQISRMTLHAPISGIVHDLRVHAAGSVVRAGQHLMDIIPQDQALFVTARLPPSERSNVRIGQEVSVQVGQGQMFDLAPLAGRVHHLSADTLTDPQFDGAFFRLQIALTPNELANTARAAHMRLGMPATAFIRTEMRTPLAYLIEPFTTFFARALRET